MKTVGDILKEARRRKRLSFGEISIATKIHPRFLRALEEGEYGVFSSEVHVRGFLRNYAKELGLDVEEVLAFWRREYKPSAPKLRSPTKPLGGPRIKITPSLILSTLVILLVTAFFSYLVIEYQSFAGVPVLTLKEPASDLTVNKPALNVVGKTDRDAVLTINGQRIDLGTEGEFATTISLSEGVNILTLVSISKLGKEARLTRTVVYEKPPAPESPAPLPQNPISSPSSEPLSP